MRNDILISVQYYCGHDLLIVVNHTTINREDCQRTYFISDEGISRHVDKENLDKCLSGEYQFDRDAIFFMKSRASCIAERLLNIKELPINIQDNLQNKLKKWGA